MRGGKIVDNCCIDRPQMTQMVLEGFSVEDVHAITAVLWDPITALVPDWLPAGLFFIGCFFKGFFFFFPSSMPSD